MSPVDWLAFLPHACAPSTCFQRVIAACFLESVILARKGD